MGALRRRRTIVAPLAPWLAISVMACIDDVGTPPWLVGERRVVAVLAEPPESRGGESTTLRALLATPEGPGAADDGTWALCTTPKPLTENNAVPAACLESGASPIPGTGASVTTVVPKESCATFGPDTPPDGPRPRDPDATGGYYQPFRFTSGTAVATVQHRITCNLANAPADAAAELRARYVPNRNPLVRSLELLRDGEALDATAIPVGATVDLTARWNADETESYLTFDPRTQSIVTRREAMTVSWFVTGGTLESATSGRTEADAETSASNRWTAPPTAQTVHLWAVLRDSRGGAAVFFKSLVVVP